MKPPARWADLRPRVISGGALALIGSVAVGLGGAWFAGVTSVATGLMMWELASMLGAGRKALIAGALGAGAILAALAARVVAAPFEIALLLAVAGAVTALVPRDRLICLAYGLAVLLAADGLADFRDENGGPWLFWLIVVVITTDIAGYFGGRLIGGPKFWPRVSPKKTWSGTVAGWIGAAAVGALFARYTSAGLGLIWISAVLSLASQMGDITESAIKRRAGVKDSSHLIPGHGGLLDRFDGLLGAALAMLVFSVFVPVPVIGLLAPVAGH
ncbi:MAG: phosphatidate cytidylyltransferase [Paracoccaceae bacterium]|nr:phosphatidate cytidylyltransferase [Paracoccaceae bacterium]